MCPVCIIRLSVCVTATCILWILFMLFSSLGKGETTSGWKEDEKRNYRTDKAQRRFISKSKVIVSKRKSTIVINISSATTSERTNERTKQTGQYSERIFQTFIQYYLTVLKNQKCTPTLSNWIGGAGFSLYCSNRIKIHFKCLRTITVTTIL